METSIHHYGIYTCWSVCLVPSTAQIGTERRPDPKRVKPRGYAFVPKSVTVRSSTLRINPYPHLFVRCFISQSPGVWVKFLTHHSAHLQDSPGNLISSFRLVSPVIYHSTQPWGDHPIATSRRRIPGFLWKLGGKPMQSCHKPSPKSWFLVGCIVSQLLVTKCCFWHRFTPQLVDTVSNQS